MQAVDETVISALSDWLATDASAWLCTIIRTYGSSPRPVGSIMAIADDGEIQGSLSGGCVEEDFLGKLAAGAFTVDAPQLLEYGLAPEDTEKLGLPCGGQLHVLLERVGPAHADHFRSIRAALTARRPLTRTVRTDTGEMALEDTGVHEPLQLLQDGRLLRHGYGPRFQLFLIGAGMVSRYLSDMALSLGFEVTVCDPREAMVEQWHVPGTRALRMMPDDGIRAHALDDRTAIVALTHDPRIDDMGLMEALTGPAFYIGAMGSARSSASRRERLNQLGIPAAAVARLRAPVGLPIGSKTPAEIAVSVIAEIVQATHALPHQQAAPATAIASAAAATG